MQQEKILVPGNLNVTFIYVTIKILDIIHSPVFYLKRNVS
jgi:hypothetical protein